MTILGYRIQRGPTDEGPWTLVYDGTAAEYVDSGLNVGDEYYYRVQAYGPDGDSDWSLPVFGTTALPIATTFALPSQLRLGPVSTMPNVSVALADIQNYINQLVSVTPVLREEAPGALGPVLLVRKPDNGWTQMRLVPPAGIEFDYDYAAHQLRMEMDTDLLEFSTIVATVSVTSPEFIGHLTGDVTGNADTVTNGVYTTGSYADPSWITSLDASKITGDYAGAVPFSNITFAGLTPNTVLRATSPTTAAFGAVALADPVAVTGVLPNVNTTGTALNTVSTLVLRDANGDFAARNITAVELTGTLQTASQPNITTIGTLVAGAVPANLVTPGTGTFGAGAYTFPSTLAVTTNATIGGTLGVTGATTLGNTLTANVETNQAIIINRSTAGTHSNLTWQVGGVGRWVIRRGSAAESGSNAGSPIQLLAFDDSGTLIDNVLDITRAAGGTFAIARPVTIASTLDVSGVLTRIGAAALDGSDPVTTLVRSTTSSSSWTAGSAFGRYGFWSQDASGTGNAIRAYLDAYNTESTGNTVGVRLVDSSSSVYSTVFETRTGSAATLAILRNTTIGGTLAIGSVGSMARTFSAVGSFVLAEADVSANSYYNASGDNAVVASTGSGTSALAVFGAHTTFNNSVLEVGAVRGSSSSYFLQRWWNGNGTTSAFATTIASLRGDGLFSLTGNIAMTTATDTNIVQWSGTNAPGILRKITDQGGVVLGVDSSLVLMAGDNIATWVAAYGITSATITEEVLIVADSNIKLFPNQQAGYTTGPSWTFNNTGQAAPVYVGASATPTYSFNSDLNTGMYRVSDGVLGFSTNDNLTLSLSTASTTFSTAAASFTGTVAIATGLTVSAGGITVTGNSTITGTLGGVTTLTTGAIAGITSITTTGTLTISGTGETLATFVDDGAVTLYYDNAAKLATATGGVSVTGTATASGALFANTALRIWRGLGDDANSIAIGSGALSATTSGTANIAIGVNVLTARTTGSNNVAIGYLVMQAGTTGSRNVAIGHQAMTISTSTDSVAIGFNALFAQTTSPNGPNTAVGARAGQDVTTGYENTLIGYAAGGSLTTQNSNVMIGANASASSTGSQNVIIGYAAGGHGSGSNNVTIGYQASASASPTSNQITLGNSSHTSWRVPGLAWTADTTDGFIWNDNGAAALDFRIEGDTVTNLFFIDASTDRAGFKTSTPAYDVDINGELNATVYRVGGTAGVDFSGAIANITIVKGIVTAAS